MTRNKQDYLKIIYELGGTTQPVSNKDIALALGISAPSVTEMIKKLLKEGYLKATPYKGTHLTEKGIQEAAQIVKRHRLWEVFLVEHLGFNWEDVHEEAEKLEHVTSLELEKRLEEYLHHPKCCPHGSVISYENENVQPMEYKTLDLILEGEEVIIKRVRDQKELLQYVSDMGLGIGDKIKIINLAPYNGPITIKKQDITIMIGKEAAKFIYVE
ncbi:MAG: metal-dependent transcriptional regulator [Epulopiscium sp.]|nr:metal-dependent transcriptional regulator [Candidatus Epulonipiscium sp.]